MDIRNRLRDNPEWDKIICYFMRTVLHIEKRGLIGLPLKNPLEEPCKSFLDRCMEIFCECFVPEVAQLLLDAEYDALLSQGPLTAEQTLCLRTIKELCWHIYYDQKDGPYRYLDHLVGMGWQSNEYAWRTYYPNLPEDVRKSLHVDEDVLARIPREMLRLDDY